MKEHATIVIGGGIAGLSCGRSLLDKGHTDFIILTEDIGGCIVSSPDGNVNYGALFVMDNYGPVLKYVEKTVLLHPSKIDFHGPKGRLYHLVQMLRYPFQLIRMLKLTFKYKSEFNNFKKETETISQAEAFQLHPFLLQLYTTRADSFIEQEKIKDLGDKFMSEAIYMAGFLPISEVSAFDFMRGTLGLIMKSHEFRFLKDKLIRGFEDQIVFDSVKDVKWDNGHLITSKKGNKYQCKNLVIATPAHVTKKLVGLNNLKEAASAFMFHIAGTLKDEWAQGTMELFRSDHTIIFIRREIDGTYLFYSQVDTPNIEKYFSEFEVVYMKPWKPAFHVIGNDIEETKRDNNTYIIGGYNIGSISDAFITGIYAANQITSAK